MTDYLPEGWLYGSEQNQRIISSADGMRGAAKNSAIAEAAPYMYDSASRTLKFRFPFGQGVMPFEHASDEPSQKEIAVIACVGKPVAFKVLDELSDGSEPMFLLSRANAMSECRREYCARLNPGDIVSCEITHIERFGCFVDIGRGITALLPTDSICYSHISDPHCVFKKGDKLTAAVRRRDQFGRLLLTHKELLGTFEENAAGFSPFDTVAGTVRTVKSYGIFIELTPNLTGLAEYSAGISPGDHVSVYIKSIIPERLKIKLAIVNRLESPTPVPSLRYYITSGHIERFRYSPPGCEKTIETIFI